ncbi:hypothetical protein E2C01_009359 [Portunus trituberculatus]|uniref:Uncharacterized protein n=1 Tax=Portunus trituberculatus TaxID=210409 RepID=A0A5B7D3B5_PORTR|nr:hypothetical protein [Portunus trituberculatus]
MKESNTLRGSMSIAAMYIRTCKSDMASKNWSSENFLRYAASVITIKLSVLHVFPQTTDLEVYVRDVLFSSGLLDVGQLRGILGGYEALVPHHRLALVAYLVSLHVHLSHGLHHYIQLYCPVYTPRFLCNHF